MTNSERWTCVLCLLAVFPFGACLGQSEAGAAKSTVAHMSCSVDKTPASEADTALASGDNEKAMQRYATLALSDPNRGTAGTIRTLLAEQKTVEALEPAREWSTTDPGNEMALETLAEVQYRRGEFAAMMQTMQSVQRLNPCSARMFLLASRFQQLQGNLDTAKKRLESAHKLAPNDPEITKVWLQSIAPASEEKATHECEPVVPVTTAEVPLKEILDGPWRRVGLALDVLVNGKLKRMQVDTGASGLVLSRGAADGLGLVREGGGETGGVGDDSLVGFTSSHVESIKIGGMEFRHCPVKFLEKQNRLDVDGLIGGDFFREYLLTLNFPDLKMRLDPLPKLPDKWAGQLHDRYVSPEMHNWTPIFTVGHYLLVPVGLTSKQGGFKDKLFLIDSGAGLMSISPDAAREVTNVSGDDRIEVYGIGGKVEKTFSTDNFDLYFGHLKQPVYGMSSFDTSEFSRSAGVEVAGFIGAPVLFRLTLRIDYRDRLVQFDYDPKNDPIKRVNSRY